jgi:hypothetical protein
MCNLCDKPVFGNILGWLFRLLWRAPKIVEFPLSYPTQPSWFAQHPQTIRVHTVKKFPLSSAVMGQNLGQYIFIREDLTADTARRAEIIRHELVHVEQQYRLGWFGVKFFIIYWWQFIVYTLRYMGIVGLALKHMPLEKEAYDKEKIMK